MKSNILMINMIALCYLLEFLNAKNFISQYWHQKKPHINSYKYFFPAKPINTLARFESSLRQQQI